MTVSVSEQKFSLQTFIGKEIQYYFMDAKKGMKVKSHLAFKCFLRSKMKQINIK